MFDSFVGDGFGGVDNLVDVDFNFDFFVERLIGQLKPVRDGFRDFRTRI